MRMQRPTLAGCAHHSSMSLGVAAAVGLAMAAASSCGYQNCTQYCGGQCPFRPNISHAGAENLTVYRMTPHNVSGVLQHNTGDARGDMGFLLFKHLEDSRCRPPYITRDCFLDDGTIVGAFNVTFDAQYGPYLRCNPNGIAGTGFVNTSDWVCAYGYPNDDPWVIKDTGCPPPCQRANVSVGKDPAQHRFWFPTWNILWAFGGYWYDTPALGECGPGRAPGDGTGCTWAVRDSPFYVNGTCLVERLFVVVERGNPSCFSQCPRGAPPTDPCYRDCLEDTVRSGKVATDALVDAWEGAFAEPGGCPHVVPDQRDAYILARR